MQEKSLNMLHSENKPLNNILRSNLNTISFILESNLITIFNDYCCLKTSMFRYIDVLKVILAEANITFHTSIL